MAKKKIAIASDHAGFFLKEILKEFLETAGYEVADHGAYDADSVDYPDYAVRVARSIVRKEAPKGILICGTGIGISIAANRFSGIRAALCHNEYTARMSRKHNDANILVLGAGVVAPALAKEITGIWLKTGFEGGRHERRINKTEELSDSLLRKKGERK